MNKIEETADMYREINISSDFKRTTSSSGLYGEVLLLQESLDIFHLSLGETR